MILEQKFDLEHLIFFRWIPQVNGAKFRRESSPLARDDCEITQSAATRWITFAKSPSPSPIPRINPERRDSITEHSKKDEESHKDADSSKWQPSRKFSPAKNEKGHLQRQGTRCTTTFIHVFRFIMRYLIADDLDIGRDRSSSFVDANDRANILSQRMRDLYDFKTENEWPKRAGSSQRENTWISKSSSEEERGNYRPIRRNSQDLEFNDRIDIFKVRELRFINDVRFKESTYTSLLPCTFLRPRFSTRRTHDGQSAVPTTPARCSRTSRRTSVYEGSTTDCDTARIAAQSDLVVASGAHIRTITTRRLGVRPGNRNRRR